MAMARNPRRYAVFIMTSRRINADFIPVSLLINVQIAAGHTHCQCVGGEKNVILIILNGQENKEDSDRTCVIKLCDYILIYLNDFITSYPVIYSSPAVCYHLFFFV